MKRKVEAITVCSLAPGTFSGLHCGESRARRAEKRKENNRAPPPAYPLYMWTQHDLRLAPRPRGFHLITREVVENRTQPITLYKKAG